MPPKRRLRSATAALTKKKKRVSVVDLTSLEPSPVLAAPALNLSTEVIQISDESDAEETAQDYRVPALGEEALRRVEDYVASIPPSTRRVDFIKEPVPSTSRAMPVIVKQHTPKDLSEAEIRLLLARIPPNSDTPKSSWIEEKRTYKQHEDLWNYVESVHMDNSTIATIRKIEEKKKTALSAQVLQHVDDSIYQPTVALYSNSASVKPPATTSSCESKENKRANAEAEAAAVVEEIPAKEIVEKKPTEKKQECPICMEPFTSETHVKATKCGHVFCSLCIGKVIKMKKKCPICRMKVVASNVISIYLFE